MVLRHACSNNQVASRIVLFIMASEEIGKELEEPLVHKPTADASLQHQVLVQNDPVTGVATDIDRDSELFRYNDKFAENLLCCSYALAAWAYRGWEFGVALILIYLTPNSLFLVSLYGLVEDVLRIMLGPYIGKYLDRTERMKGARHMYMFQNAGIALSAAACVTVLFVWPPSPSSSPFPPPPPSSMDTHALALPLPKNVRHLFEALVHPRSLLLGMTVFCGALSGVGGSGIVLAVEREMPKVVCHNEPFALSRMNAKLRAIDLSSLLLSPIVCGSLMTYESQILDLIHKVVISLFGVSSGGGLDGQYSGITVGAIKSWTPPPGLLAVAVLGLYGMLAWIPEISFLEAAAAKCPRLRGFKSHEMSPSSQGNDSPAPSETTPPTSTPSSFTPPAPTPSQGKKRGAFETYLSQTIFLPNFALAMLYMTVLSLGYLMTCYLKWTGLTESSLGVIRGGGALTGLLATVLYPGLRFKFGATSTAVMGILWQLICLSVGVLPVLAYTYGTSSSSYGKDWLSEWDEKGGEGVQGPPPILGWVLAGGLALSRMGLWLFDLAVSQLMQEHVSSDEIGSVGGVQNSLQSSFELAAYFVGTLIPDPKAFPVLMAGSLIVVAMATFLVIVYALKQRVSHSAGGGV